jgi:hypothetical protein
MSLRSSGLQIARCGLHFGVVIMAAIKWQAPIAPYGLSFPG